MPQSMAWRMTRPRAWLIARTVPMKYHSSPVMHSDLSELRLAMLSRWLFFSMMKGSLMLGQGTPTTKTARHIPSGKSMPSLTFPRQMIASIAPFLDSAFFLKSPMLMSVLFSSKITSFTAISRSFLGERISSYLNSPWILKEGKTRRMPLGILLAAWMRNSMRSLQISFLFLERLSQVKVNLVLEGPLLITRAAICYSEITCRLDSWLPKRTFSSFSHIPSGFSVPEVSRIDRGFNLRMSRKVSHGTKHLRPTVKPPDPRFTKRRQWLSSSSTQAFSVGLWILGERSILILRQKARTRSKLLQTPSGVSLSSSMRVTPQAVNSSMGRMSLVIMTDLQKSCRCWKSLLRSSPTAPQNSSNSAWSVRSLLISRTSLSSLLLSLLKRSSSREAKVSSMKSAKLSLKSSIFCTRNLISASLRERTPSRLGERKRERILLSSRRAESRLWVSRTRERPSQAASETLCASSKMMMLFSMSSWQLLSMNSSSRQLQGMMNSVEKSFVWIGQKQGQNISSRPACRMISMSSSAFASLRRPIAITSSRSLWNSHAASTAFASSSLLLIASFFSLRASFTPRPHASIFSLPRSAARLSLRQSCSREAKMAMLGRQQVLASSFCTCRSCECVRDMQITLWRTFSERNCCSTKESTEASRHSVLPVPVGDSSTALPELLSACTTCSMYSTCTLYGSQGKQTLLPPTLTSLCPSTSLRFTTNIWFSSRDYRL